MVNASREEELVDSDFVSEIECREGGEEAAVSVSSFPSTTAVYRDGDDSACSASNGSPSSSCGSISQLPTSPRCTVNVNPQRFTIQAVSDTQDRKRSRRQAVSEDCALDDIMCQSKSCDHGDR
jgi:hypothetical protein